MIENTKLLDEIDRLKARIAKLESALVDQLRAGSGPHMSPIRRAAMSLFSAPFKFQAGYVFDASSHMVADDGHIDEQINIIAARIRGWGRIGYMDNPEGRAAALQDEVGAIVVDALNAYWELHPHEPVATSA